MAAPNPLQGLLDKEKMLTAKIERFKSGEIKGQDEDHTAEAQARVETQLREVRKALSEQKKESAK